MTFDQQIQKAYADRFTKFDSIEGAREALALKGYIPQSNAMWKRGDHKAWVTPLIRQRAHNSAPLHDGYLVTWGESKPETPVLFQEWAV